MWSRWQHYSDRNTYNSSAAISIMPKTVTWHLLGLSAPLTSTATHSSHCTHSTTRCGPAPLSLPGEQVCACHNLRPSCLLQHTICQAGQCSSPRSSINCPLDSGSPVLRAATCLRRWKGKRMESCQSCTDTNSLCHVL